MIDDRTEAAPAARPTGGAAPRLAGLTPALVLRAALRRRWLVVATTLATVLLVALGSTLLKPRYAATTQVFIDPRGVQAVQNDITANNVDSNAFTNLVESQTLIVLADKVLRPVVDSARLYADPDFAGRLAVPEDGADPAALEAARKAAVDTLKRQASVRRPERTSVIEITVTATAGEKAADLANAMAQSYLAQLAANQADLAQRTTSLLNDRLDTMQRRVREAETKVQDYKTRHNLLATPTGPVTEAQLADVNAQLGAARGKVADAQSRYDQIVAAQRSPDALGALPEAVSSVTIGNLRVQNVEARRSLASLSAVLGTQHPSVRAAAAQVEDTRRALDSELSRLAAASRMELKRAKDNETELTKTVDTLKGQVSDAGTASVGLRELEREADASRNVYQSFLARSRETGELAGLGATNASIVTAASAPASRSFPPRLSLLLMVGLVLGALVGLALAVLLEQMWPQPGAAAGDAAAAVPPAAAPRQPAAAPQAAAAPPPAPDPAPAFTPGPPVEAPPVFAAAAEETPLPEAALPAAVLPAAVLPEAVLPDMPLPEAIRLAPFPPAVLRNQERGQLDLTQIGLPVLTTSVAEHRAFLADMIAAIRPAPGPAAPRCLMVAGVNPAEQRTTLALNLALAAQARGARVMLMDYDEGGRLLTRRVAGALRHPLIGEAGDAGRLFHPTQTGIGLILFPERTPMSAIDPMQICDTVFDGRGFDLLVCDGPADLAGIRQDAATDIRRIGVVLTVDAGSAVPPDADPRRSVLGPCILKLVAVAEPGPEKAAAKPAA